MFFGLAMERLLDGHKIRRKGWGGYWCRGNGPNNDGNGVDIHLKNGQVLRNTSNDLFLTLTNCMAGDWELCDDGINGGKIRDEYIH